MTAAGVLDVIGVQAENAKEKVIKSLQVVGDLDQSPNHGDLDPDHDLHQEVPDVPSITARMIVIGVNQNLVHLRQIP